MQNFTSDFNSRRPFAQILASQNSNGKYESRKILDFLKKKIGWDMSYFLVVYTLVFFCSHHIKSKQSTSTVKLLEL
jgi:hypothetical protein